MTGVLYGIGVGPGDPELLTLKAVRRIQECDIIIVPGKDYRESIAYQIAVQAVPELEKKEIHSVVMPMVRDESVRQAHHEEAAGRTIDWLKQGYKVGMLNLGDVTIYATYTYIQRLVRQAGYETEEINGIPSFCAAAARLHLDLALGEEGIHILAASDWLASGADYPGTKIIMKIGTQLSLVKDRIRSLGMTAVMIENCTMAGEGVYHSLDEIPETAGYYSLVIVKG